MCVHRVKVRVEIKLGGIKDGGERSRESKLIIKIAFSLIDNFGIIKSRSRSSSSGATHNSASSRFYLYQLLLNNFHPLLSLSLDVVENGKLYFRAVLSRNERGAKHVLLTQRERKDSNNTQHRTIKINILYVT